MLTTYQTSCERWNMSEIADKIRERRKNLGLSQEGLAERLHVSRQTISSWENGKSAIKLENAKPLSYELKIPLTDQAPLSPLEASHNHPSPGPSRRGPGPPWCDNASRGYASRTLRRMPGAPDEGRLSSSLLSRRKNKITCRNAPTRKLNYLFPGV